MIGVILMTTQKNNFRAPESHKTVFSASPVYKILFGLDSIGIATYIVCAIGDINIELRPLLAVLFPWLLLLWILLFNKTFGGISRAVRGVLGRDY